MQQQQQQLCARVQQPAASCFTTIWHFSLESFVSKVNVYLSVRCRNKSHEFIYMTNQEPVREQGNGLLNLLGPEEILNHFGHVPSFGRSSDKREICLCSQMFWNCVYASYINDCYPHESRICRKLTWGRLLQWGSCPGGSFFHWQWQEDSPPGFRMSPDCSRLLSGQLLSRSQSQGPESVTAGMIFLILNLLMFNSSNFIIFIIFIISGYVKFLLKPEHR